MSEMDEEYIFSNNSLSNFSAISEGDLQIGKHFSENDSSNKSGKFYGKEQKDPLYFICKKCHSSPNISFCTNYLLSTSCLCMEIHNLTYLTFFDYYSFQDKNDIEKYFYCKDHKENKYKYEYYCIDCEKNLCILCYEKSKIHENHTIIFLLSFDNLIDDLYHLIDNITGIIFKGDEYNTLLFIIKSILDKYKDYPSYNLYTSMEKAKKFLIELKNIQTVELIKINSLKDLMDSQYKMFSIKSIIINKENFNDLSLFKNVDFKNLEHLELQDNCIQDIEPLLNCNFENLKKLILENNKLNYESLKNLDKMKFKNIELINLFQNEIKSPKIFEKIENFKTLKIFHIGKNKFDIKEINKIIKTGKKYDLKYLERIGLTGDFSDETIHFIEFLLFKDLIVLYLNGCNLTSLKFSNKISCPNLKSFWAINNNLTDYNDLKQLKYKENITNINLKGNKIKNIDNILDFISNFPSLKRINLSENKINLEDLNNQKIIEEAKKNYGNDILIFDNKKSTEEF